MNGLKIILIFVNIFQSFDDNISNQTFLSKRFVHLNIFTLKFFKVFQILVSSFNHYINGILFYANTLNT